MHKLWELVSKHQGVWRAELGSDPPADVMPMMIEMIEEAELPRRQGNRRYVPLQKEFLTEHVEMLLKTGVAQPH